MINIDDSDLKRISGGRQISTLGWGCGTGLGIRFYSNVKKGNNHRMKQKRKHHMTHNNYCRVR